MNEIWHYTTGYLMGYTEDKDLMRRIKRYKTDANGWTIVAEYYRKDRLFGLQYSIPIEQRRQAMRMFDVADIEE